MAYLRRLGLRGMIKVGRDVGYLMVPSRWPHQFDSRSSASVEEMDAAAYVDEQARIERGIRERSRDAQAIIAHHGHPVAHDAEKPLAVSPGLAGGESPTPAITAAHLPHDFGDKLVEEAKARHEMHKDHLSHRPLSVNYELKGLRGEQALAEFLGNDIDWERRPNGDGGKDNTITAKDGLRYPIDVKCASKPNNLIVEVGKVGGLTIYVLAGYNSETDQATLLGWQWGSIVEAAPVKDFGYGVYNHYIPVGNLRSMEELRDAIRATDSPGPT